ncbi:related to adenosylmethionine-8-amino-7-oxononanoate aminotransferase [Cephalotrichum gorgonifer]|uniref:Related to adenosylmethionine-8-amino-7-oxononanoate aminotransferase n=1 Tax=Cephalotrichum gorgonifer TaxID=2041049 RepID=A0AAE8SUC2_9PEZI|nr:related to adenosylmethionine-8-amino-7-oxononanoate aminotransferase [Cephalotrichum gorgonifer]
MAPVSALLRRHLRVHQIYGANTDVGKTIFATALCRAAAKLCKAESTSFLKPVSTGPSDEADSWSKLTGHDQTHIKRYAPSTADETLFQYDVACSPHSAAIRSGKISDSVSRRAALGPGWLFIETAGGVHSPGPSGTPQADLYAPLRVPAILVGDSKLGGISQTIAAFESLKLRGYDIDTLLLFQDEQYQNHLYLRDYFSTRADVSIETIPSPPRRSDDDSLETKTMMSYYDLTSSSDTMSRVLENLDRRGKDRIARLESMSDKASKSIWYPFTQQKHLSPDRISAIDSAHGDFFQVLTPEKSSANADDRPLLQAAFDGSASWWTQGLGHANPRLTLAAAYAAGRYGHVMFAGTIHEPALALAETLLREMRNPRLSRVFYTDNGSTGCEVAIKMALRAARTRYGWTAEEKLDILGLRGCYHGDTMGAMDCAEPNPFNEKVEWYEGKGFWFEYPTIRCFNGEWLVDVPSSLRGDLGNGAGFDSLSGVFELGARTKSDTFDDYKRYIHSTLERLHAEGRKFGALMIEPIILGAGGMIFVDPLFQRALIDVVRENPHLFGRAVSSAPQDENTWAGLPVVFDEVFTGLYRLGRFSASSLLGTHPDISVHAKMLTGGLVPLCATLASESIFSAFEGDEKSDALLHGHSYTAHAVGCQVAVESLREMLGMESRGAWDWAKADGWVTDQQHPQDINGMVPGPSGGLDDPTITQPVWSMWPREFVEHLSGQVPKVTGVWALGSILAISMAAKDGAGYESNAAAGLQTFLGKGTGSWNAHTRVLGNVFYVMASLTTSQESIKDMQNLLLEALKE